MRAWLVLLLLAGCSSPPEAGPAGDPEPITDPGAFVADGMSHVHDYWRGQHTVVIYDDTVTLTTRHEMLSEVTGEGDPGECRSTSGWDCFVAPVPAGMLVFPGTRWVNLTIDWRTTKGPTEPGFIGHAIHRGGQVGMIPPAGVEATYAINTTEEINDMAHATNSHWRFRFQLTGFGVSAYEPAVHEIEMKLRITVARPPGPLPVWDPHPDHWGNRTEWPFYTDQQSFNVPGAPNHPPILPQAGKPFIVPPETAFLQVDQWLNLTGDPVMPPAPIVWYHVGIDRPTTAEDTPIDAHHTRWIIPITPDEWDSPYAEETEWYVAWRNRDHGEREPWLNGGTSVLKAKLVRIT